MNRHAFVTSFLFLAASAALPVAFAQTGLINTIAGGGTGGVGIPATSAALYGPVGVRVDSLDNLYIADSGGNRVVRVDSVTGILTLIAGNGASASSGDAGPATQASVYSPRDVALDAAGNIFIAEMGAHKIRRVDAVTGIITTVAGSGTAGFSGDGGPASAAQLSSPSGLVFDSTGSLYVADSGNMRIRRIDHSGTITTVAGNGTSGVSPDGIAATSASFTPPMGVGLDGWGAVLITDRGAAKIRRVDPATGILGTIAGNGSTSFTGDGVAATSAGIGSGIGAAVADPAGNLYFSDATGRIRRIDAATQTITTVAGNGSGAQGMASSGGGSGPYTPPPVYGDGGPATNATLDGAISVALTHNGNLLLSDWIDGRVRRVYLPSPLAYTNTTVAANIMGGGVQMIATVAPIGGTGNPTGSLQFVAQTITPYSITSRLLSTVSLAGPAGLAVFTYSPASSLAGQAIVVYYSGDSNFNGSGSPPAPVTNLPSPTIALTSSQNPVAANAPATLTVTVSPSGSTPTGTVQVWNGSNWLPTATLVNGSAQVTTSFATPGTYNLGAMYSGDSNYARSLSGNLTLTVKPSTSVNLTSSSNPSAAGSSVTFTAMISPSSATGTVQFLDGTTVLGSAGIANGVATFATSNLNAGNHSIQAVYSGDASNPGASSPVLTQVVSNAQNPTTSSLTAGQNPTSQGFQNTYVVQVNSTAGGTPTGTVQLLDNGNPLATATLNTGEGQFQVALNGTGTHPLTAVYSGDGSFAGSTSAVLNEVVKLTASGTISVDINPVTAGSTATFTCTVYQSGATGTVQLLEYPTPGGNAITLMTVPLNGQTAVFPISTLSAGSHNIAAAYSGDATYLEFGTAYIVEVVRAATTTTVSAPSGSSIYAQAAIFTAAVSPAAATGTVQFLDGATSLGSATLNGGAASVTVSTLTAGTHSITAVYSGDSANAGSTSAAWTQTVAKANTTAALASSLNPAPDGQAVTLTATLSPAAATGTVQFLDGAAVLGTVALTNGTASISPSLATGSHSLTALYSGDGNYSGATSAAVSEVITTTTTTTATANPATPSYGQSVQLTAAVTPAAASGSIQFFDGSTPLGTATLSGGTASFTVAAFAVGAHSITAAYSGDGGAYLASASAALGLTVSKAAASVAAASSLNPANSGQAVTFSASVSPTSASGSIQFLDGATALGTVALSNGAASFSTSSLTTGTHSITAVYSGDANYSGGTSPIISQVVKAISTVAIQSSAAIAAYGQAVQFTAAVSPSTASGTIQFFDGGISAGMAAITGGAASITVSTLAVGSHSITAVYSGDANDTSGTSGAISQTITKDNTAVALQANPAASSYGQAVQISATVSPAGATGTVQFLDNGTVLGTANLGSGLASLTVSAFPVGTHTLTAVYGGDGNDLSSTSAAVTITVAQATPTVTLVSSPNPSLTGQAVTFTAAVAPTAATGTIQFLDGTTSLGTATLNAGVATWTTSALTAGTHTITAKYSGNASYTAAIASVSQVVNVPPAAPTNLKANSAPGGQVNLNWNASRTAGVTYNVYSSTVSNFTPSAANLIASGIPITSYTNTGLAPSTTYYYFVTAQNTVGESAPSNKASATTKNH